jgi:hypothetical protein
MRDHIQEVRQFAAGKTRAAAPQRRRRRSHALVTRRVVVFQRSASRVRSSATLATGKLHA